MNAQTIIKKLLKSGMTQVQIAAAIGCSQPSVSDIATGKTSDPALSIGLALIDLAKKQGIDLPVLSS